MNKISSLTISEISNLWTIYHKSKFSYGSSLTGTNYNKLKEALAKYPRVNNPINIEFLLFIRQFLFPIKRPEGYEFYYMERQHHTIYFTSLIEYKQKLESASPYYSFVFYTELCEEKDLVLLKCEFGTSKEKANMDDLLLDFSMASLLLKLIEHFYLLSDSAKKLVDKFHLDPDSFDHNELLKEAKIFYD